MDNGEQAVLVPFIGTQLTLLRILCVMLPLVIVDLSAEAFSVMGVLLAVVGTVTVAYGLTR
jgi:hypothetical protein